MVATGLARSRNVGQRRWLSRISFIFLQGSFSFSGSSTIVRDVAVGGAGAGGVHLGAALGPPPAARLLGLPIPGRSPISVLIGNHGMSTQASSSTLFTVCSHPAFPFTKIPSHGPGHLTHRERTREIQVVDAKCQRCSRLARRQVMVRPSREVESDHPL